MTSSTPRSPSLKLGITAEPSQTSLTPSVKQNLAGQLARFERQGQKIRKPKTC